MVAGIFALVSACAPAAAKKEAEPAKEAAKKEEAAPAPKPLTPEDATYEDGVLTRTNAPAFTLDITEEGRKVGKPDLTAGQIFTSSAGSPPWTVLVAIGDLGDGLKAAAQAVADGYVDWAKNVIKTKNVEIIAIEPIDTYDEFEAMQIEMEYVHTDGSTVLTILHHVIAKGDKTIILSAWLMGDPEQATSIYETIDLDP